MNPEFSFKSQWLGCKCEQFSPFLATWLHTADRPGVPCLQPNSDKKKKKKAWKSDGSSAGSVSPGAPPSPKPQQLSSTAPRNVQEGLRHDRRRGEKRSEVWVAAATPTLTLESNFYMHWKAHLYKDKRPRSPPAHRCAPLVCLAIWNLSKTGSAKLSVSMQRLFHQDFWRERGASLYRIQQLRASYLVLLSSRWELHKGLKCTCVSFMSGIFQNIDSWSGVNKVCVATSTCSLISYNL